MGRETRFGRAVGALLACVLAGSLVAAATASADTTGYYVYNLTGKTWELFDVYEWKQGFEPSPPGPAHPREGQVLMPGADPGHNHFEIVVGPVEYREPHDAARLQYSADGGSSIAHVYLDKFRDLSTCKISGPYVCDFDGTTVQILEPPGTEHTVPAADKVKQAEVLGNRVCTARNTAARLGGCQFDLEPRIEALGQAHLAGAVSANCDTVERSVSNTLIDEEVVSDSAGGKLGDGADSDYIFQRALASIEPRYGRWTENHTFRGDVDYTVPPGHIGFVVARNPVSRDTGTFMTVIGNTHFYLEDLSFDSPDVAGTPEYTSTTQPMTADQRKQACEAGRSRRVPASFASIKRGGTSTGDALLGGRESTFMHALGGNDILRGEAGNDRLYGGPGRDALYGGRGHDRLYGGPGSDTIVDQSGRTIVRAGRGSGSRRDSVDVRDRQGDDTVVCGSRRTIVRADRRDRLRNCG